MMRWLRDLPRERADILLLLLAVAMVLAPHAGHFPPWLSVAMAVPLLWRAALAVGNKRQPPLGWLMLLAMLAISGVHLSYGSLLGRDPGVAMLALLLSLKSLEMHGRRDVFVLVFICFFLLLANFFHAQGLLSAVWMLATLIVLLAALLSFHFGPVQPRWPARLRLLGRLLALALPLSALLFFMMPRLASPLWGKAGMGTQGMTGLSDSMQPGAIAQLARSNDPVFTAHFTTALPPQGALYWRGVVLGDYDGATWTRSAASGTPGKIDIVLAGERLDYQVDLLPSGQRRIFALDLPRSIQRLPGNPYVVSPALELLTVQPISSAVRYRASSQIRYRLQAQLTPQQKQPWLALPPGANPRSLAWARQLRAGQPTQQAAIAAVLAHFRQAPFRYTLQPPLLGKDGVDDFLFRTRAGFCEHYAGSFVVLMRAMAIPARVVTGYQGGLRDDTARSITVRQSDAHAWSEVWLPDQGWVRIDPTSQVAPMRTERNLDAALPAAPAQAGGWRPLQSLNHAWQRAEQGWQRWVIDYTPERQRALFDAVLALQARQVAAACALLAALAATAGALLWWQQRPGRHPGAALDQLYARFCRLQARRGHSRAPHEGPHGYAARLAASPASPRAHDAMARFLAIYAAMKYGNASPDEHTRARRELRRLLTLCR
ncbi:transglutaminase TgpA family protein [Janthinobacterium sp. RB2R34]|uniref:transglutaminase TgpA family protein n=1 Tax=Janthinobacterium sp. RB2R34 TaxID=3424193 RepID=UPI003F20EC62